MSCPCSGEEIIDIKVRSKYEDNDEQFLYNEDRLPLPLKLQAAKFIGLQTVLLNKFLFMPPFSRYQIRDGNMYIMTNPPPPFASQTVKQPVKGFEFELYKPMKGYTITATILQHAAAKRSVPIIHFKSTHQNSNTKTNPVIIYSHGNSSDLFDSLKFIQKIICRWEQYLENNENQRMINCGQLADSLSETYCLEFLAYDYTGYGQSLYHRKNSSGFLISQSSMREDLQSVIEWLGKESADKLILWGFSLGCVPTIYSSTKHKGLATIIQSAFVSIANYLNAPEIIQTTPYQGDLFSNLQRIGQIKSGRVMIMHGTEDEIIPIRHSQVLFQRYLQVNLKKTQRQYRKGRHSHSSRRNLKEREGGVTSLGGKQQARQLEKLEEEVRSRINLVKIQKLSHNGIHPYLVSRFPNSLQKYFFNFIYRRCKSLTKNQKLIVSAESQELPNLQCFKRLYNQGQVELRRQNNAKSILQMAQSTKSSLPAVIQKQEQPLSRHHKHLNSQQEFKNNQQIQDETGANIINEGLVNKMAYRKQNYF